MTLSVFSYHPLVSGVFSKYGVQCLVFGVWCLAVGGRCLVSGGRCSMFGVCFLLLMKGPFLVSGGRCLVSGGRCLVSGVWFLPLMKGPFLVSVHMPNLAFLCSERALDSKQFER